MQTVVNLRDHAVNFIPFRVEGGIRVIDMNEVEVDAGGTVDVDDECAFGAPYVGRGGLLDQEENWALATAAPKTKPKPSADAETEQGS